jgi:hypothetical protein
MAKGVLSKFFSVPYFFLIKEFSILTEKNYHDKCPPFHFHRRIPRRILLPSVL